MLPVLIVGVQKDDAGVWSETTSVISGDKSLDDCPFKFKINFIRILLFEIIFRIDYRTFGISREAKRESLRNSRIDSIVHDTNNFMNRNKGRRNLEIIYFIGMDPRIYVVKVVLGNE